MKKILLLTLSLFTFFYANSQNCISESQTLQTWTNVPYLDGHESYIEIRAKNQSESNNASQWVEGDFTIDTWIKPTWSTNPSECDERYTLFSAGPWGDDHNSVYILFQKNGDGSWTLRVSDGYDDGSNGDLRHNINYASDYYNKWRHVTLTFSQSVLRLYIDGEKVQEKTSFLIENEDIPWWHITIGHHSDRSEDFRGYVSGFRIWDNLKMTDAEVAYIWNKTFDGVNSMENSWQYLYNSLVVNMFTSSSDIYSLTDNALMSESGIVRKSDVFHPGLPVKAYNFTSSNNCDEIHLNWTNSGSHATNYVYRKLEGESGRGTLVCRTNDNYFIDSEPDVAPGQNYTYTLVSVWKNPNNPFFRNNGLYEQVVGEQTIALRKYPQIKNLTVLDDASMGNCNAQVSLKWDPITPAPTDYYIQYKLEGGSFTTLVNGLNATEYLHNVSSNLLGKEITYRIDAGGDGCVNPSNEVVASANEACSTVPTNATADINGDNITVNWDFTQSGAPATAFSIYRSEEGGSFNLLQNDISVKDRSFSDLSAIMCTNYQYKVEAYNSCGSILSVASGTVKIPVQFGNVFTFDASPYFDASKGYYNQQVELEWKVNPDKKADIENIEIYRHKPNQTYTLISTIENPNTTYWADQNSDANQIYEYLIRATGHCGVDEVISDSLKTIGFRTSTGIVSGKVTFEGGNAVENAEVVIDAENPIQTSSFWFNGQDNMLTTENSTAFAEKNLVNNSLSFEAWIKPELSTSGYRKIIFSEDLLRLNLYLVNMRPTVILNDKAVNEGAQTPLAIAASDTVLEAGKWSHIAFTLDAENGKLTLFLNGEELNTADYMPVIPWGNTDASAQKVQIGGSVQSAGNLGFYGNIDEVRLWQKVKTAEEIKRDYKRILTGSEENLIGYWRFDENYGNYTYDLSKSGSEFNKIDLLAQNANMPQWSEATPPYSLLRPSGVTNQKGNYVIKGIGYAGQGSLFTATPMLGVHEFDPADVNLFISDNSPVHNKIDFTDISSFRVTGSVIYENTNMPVQDVYVKIDGNYIQGANNQIVKTDQYGAFDIQVPIGNHYIELEKHGHQFISAYFPERENENEIKNFYFNEPIYGLKFYDNTKVKLAGKVVGGAVEAGKAIGSQANPTKNNLGVCEITFTTEKGYTLENGKADTTIYTNSETGMYEIEMYPELYKITTVKVNDTYNFLDNETEIADLSNSFMPFYTIDEFENENGGIEYDTVFTYNLEKNWIWRSNPKIIVRNAENTKVFGDSLFIVRAGAADQDTIKIAQMQNGEAEYVFGKPVFSMEKSYIFKIMAFEEYVNTDDVQNTVYDTVPVTDGEIVIINDCANNTNQQNLKLNTEGKAVYNFWGGLPNLSNPYTKKIEIKLKVADSYFDWEQSPLSAYVSGNKSAGSNFVTKGPNSLDFILRDPPGSNSYSFLEKGLEITRESTLSNTHGQYGSDQIVYHFGNTLVTNAGSSFFSVQSEFDLENNIGITLDHSENWGNERTFSETVTFNQSFSTSGSPDYVGDAGDVFIGHSSNIIYGTSDFINIMNINDLPTDTETLDTLEIAGQKYTIAKRKGLSLGKEIATSFVYTQNHIENYLIPNLEMLRNLVYDNNKSYYTLVFSDSESEKFLTNNDDEDVWANEASDDKYNGPSYVFDNPNEDDLIDSVRFYNNQIIEWKDILAQNEEAKLKSVKDDHFPANISFDAGSEYEASVQIDTVNTNTKSFEVTLSPAVTADLGFKVNNRGLSFHFEEGYNYEHDSTTTHDTLTTQTVGFHLADEDQGDYFSVNIRKDEEMGFGPVFRTQGGQSSCPYEDASYTKYYKPGKILNQATMKVEVPEIAVDKNIISGVPETNSAYFKFSLSNNSEVQADAWYMLFVDPASNPDGAVVKMDGAPISASAKAILIPAGQTVYKTLTVTKGQEDINNYDSLAVILHSACQFDPTNDITDISDTVFISAQFSPACTSVEFGGIYPDWTANISNNDTIQFQIKNYDLNSTKLKSINFQYAAVGAPRTNNMVFFKDEQDFIDASDPKTWINGETTLNYAFDISNLLDGKYELYLKTVCDDGSEFICEPLQGIIDRIAPKAFGSPQPSDGILSPDDEISLLFNEEINSGHFYSHPDYIQVRGVTNGTDLQHNESLLHDASIHFDGVNNHLLVRDGINLDHTSFTIEFWAKREASGEECLLSLGSLSTGLWIGFNDNNQFVFRLGEDVLISDNTYTTSDNWSHFACVFDLGESADNAIMKIQAAAGTNTEEKAVSATAYTALEALLYVGFCPENQTAFNGNMHELRIWNKARQAGEISSDKTKILTGYEQSLYSLWAMNEASGKLANDKVFGKDAEVNATWQVSRNGKSLTFAGSDYAKAETQQMVFDAETDFTIEFWFKAFAPANDMCLFSNGNGNGNFGESIWTVSLRADNMLEVQNNGNSILFDASDYTNNSWHHFALSVNRLAYTTVYLDGKAVKTAQSSNFKGFASANMVLGAKVWTSNQTTYTENFFTGEMDELRIWNNNRSKAEIQQYMNHSLSGNEFGLKAYFPFEDTSNPDPSVSTETLSNMTNDDQSVADNITLMQNAAFSGESPNIKLQRAESEIPFKYVINTDRLIITPDVAASEIENTTLNISVKKAKDLNNNTMSSSVSWIAFIDKNQLVWDKKEIQIEKGLSDEKQFSVNISNKGGMTESFELTNIPDWLEVYPLRGSLNPQQSIEIDFNIKPILNIGNYTRDINLVASMGYNERLNLKVKVKAAEPDWTVAPEDYEYSASIIGQLSINQVINTNTDTKVAAFINGECRGVSHVQYFSAGDIYLVFVDVYDNQLSGNNINFKIFDASTGEIYSQVTPVLQFEANKLYGSAASPISIEASNGIEQSLDLQKGWNWISFNVYNSDFKNLDLLFAEMQKTGSDIIKSNAFYSQYTAANIWEGTLKELNYKEMYKLKLNTPQILTVKGAKVIADTVGIQIVPGWNWVSFPVNSNQELNDALSSLSPSESDLFKSQNQFAIFDHNLGWLGSLKYLHTGEGYMYKSASHQTLNFSASTMKFAPKTDTNFNFEPTPDNMTVIAKVNADISGQEFLNAFAENKLCGQSEAFRINGEQYFFLTLNAKTEQFIKFGLENSQGEHFTAEENLTFYPNQHIGSLDEPFILNFKALGKENQELNNSEIYPNPFTEQIELKFSNAFAEKISLKIYNSVGILLSSQTIEKPKNGNVINLTKHFNKFAKGIYILKINSDGKEEIFRLIKQ